MRTSVNCASPIPTAQRGHMRPQAAPKGALMGPHGPPWAHNGSTQLFSSARSTVYACPFRYGCDAYFNEGISAASRRSLMVAKSKLQKVLNQRAQVQVVQVLHLIEMKRVILYSVLLKELHNCENYLLVPELQHLMIVMKPFYKNQLKNQECVKKHLAKPRWKKPLPGRYFHLKQGS